MNTGDFRFRHPTTARAPFSRPITIRQRLLIQQHWAQSHQSAEEQNLLSFSGTSDVFDTYLTIRQNNTLYFPQDFYGLQHTNPGWYGNDHLYTTGAISTPSGWTRYIGNGPNTPVFSSSGGSSIEFGIAVGSYFNSGSGQIVGGIDNWTVSIGYTPIPEPSNLLALLALVLISVCGSRHSRRELRASAFKVSHFPHT